MSFIAHSINILVWRRFSCLWDFTGESLLVEPTNKYSQTDTDTEVVSVSGAFWRQSSLNCILLLVVCYWQLLHEGLWTANWELENSSCFRESEREGRKQTMGKRSSLDEDTVLYKPPRCIFWTLFFSFSEKLFCMHLPPLGPLLVLDLSTQWCVCFFAVLC